MNNSEIQRDRECKQNEGMENIYETLQNQPANSQRDQALDYEITVMFYATAILQLGTCIQKIYGNFVMSSYCILRFFPI